MHHWKSRRLGISKTQYEVLTFLAKFRPGVFKPLDARLERAAKLMVQGVHPLLKTMASRTEEGTTLYTVTSDGRAKLSVAKRQRGE